MTLSFLTSQACWRVSCQSFILIAFLSLSYLFAVGLLVTQITSFAATNKLWKTFLSLSMDILWSPLMRAGMLILLILFFGWEVCIKIIISLLWITCVDVMETMETHYFLGLIIVYSFRVLYPRDSISKHGMCWKNSSPNVAIIPVCCASKGHACIVCKLQFNSESLHRHLSVEVSECQL